MTKQTEALKLALEALQATMATHGTWDAVCDAKEKAITAIREALAEQPAHCEAGPDYCQICSDEQVQDILKIGNPTEEEYRLIRLGWDAAMRLAEQPAQQQPDEVTIWKARAMQAEAVIAKFMEQPAQQQEPDYNICPTCGGMASDPIVPPEYRHQSAERVEPVAWRVSYPNDPELGFWFAEGTGGEGCLNEPLYTSPPASKPWVGLTQQDIDIAFDDTQEGGGFNEFARAIEAKLKEKNNG